MTDSSPGSRATALHVRWLVRLRWAAIAAQLGSLFGVKYLLHAPFPLVPLLMVVAVLAFINVLVWLRLRSVDALSNAAVAANLLLDVGALTALLIWTGGAMNPFTTLYMLQIALAAILVPGRWSLVVTLGAIVAFGGLLLARPEAIHVWHSASMFMLHVRGMWVAFAITATSLWFFVDRVSDALRERDAELSRARVRALRDERLAALGTLAAGTAHELNTPLGTMAVLAAELSDALASQPDARAQADRIREQVRRCAAILRRMRSNESSPEPAELVALGAWARESVAQWASQHDGITVRVEVDGEPHCRVQREALAAALRSVLDNARLSGGREPIEVRVSPRGEDTAALAVIDRGAGIPQEHLAHVGEPFFTTREPGEGMGLGLYLARMTAAQQGGSLAVRSEPGRTDVEFVLPIAAGD